jgi:hypothetical protein
MPLFYAALQSVTKRKTSTTETRRTTPSNSQSQNLTADDADKTDLHGLKKVNKRHFELKIRGEVCFCRECNDFR